MPATNEEIRYQFEADTSKLKPGIDRAMGMLDELEAKTKSLGSMKKNPGGADRLNDVVSAVKRVNTGISDTINKAAELEKRMIKSMTTFEMFGAIGDTVKGAWDAVTDVFSAVSGVAIGSILEDSIQKAIDYVETLELFRVAVNGAFSAAAKFVNTLEQLYGMDPNSIMQSYGMFSQLANAIDMPTRAASKLSQGLTKVAMDMSSLFNMEFEDVVTDLTAGMQGMVRAMRKFGVDIRNTTLQRIADSLGLNEQVSQMTEANRQGLRYLAIMKQMEHVHGNFSSTIESVANQFRVLREQLSGVSRAIGNLFMPMLQSLIYKLVAVAMVIKTVLTYIGMLIGFIPQTFSSSADDATDSVNGLAGAIGGAGGAASKAAKEMKYLMSFDELNLLEPPQDAGGGGGGGIVSDEIMDPAIVAAIEAINVAMEDYTMKAIKARDAMMKFLGFFSTDGKSFFIEFDWDTGKWKTNIKWSAKQLEKNLIDKFPRWSKTIETLFSSASDIWGSIQRLWKDIGKAIDEAFEPLKAFFNEKFSDENVARWIEDLPDNIEWLGSIIKRWAPTIGTFFSGLAELGAAIFENVDFKGIIESVTELVEALGPYLEILGKGFNEEIGSIVGEGSQTLIDFIDGITDAIAGADEGKIESFGAFLADLVVWLPIIAPISTALSGLSNSMLGLIQTLALIKVGGGASGLFGALFGTGGAAAAAGGAAAGEAAIAGAGGAAGVALGPILAIVAAIAAVIGISAILISKNEELKSKWAATWEQIKTIFVSLWEGGLKPAFTALWGYIVMLWNNALKPLFEGLLGEGIPVLTILFAVLNIVGIALNAVLNAVVTVVGAIVLFVTWIIQLVTAINLAAQALQDFVGAIASGDLTGGFAKLKEDMGSIWSTFASNAGQAAEDFGKTTGEMWTTFGNTTETQWATAIDGLVTPDTALNQAKTNGTKLGGSYADGFQTGISNNTVARYDMIDRPRMRDQLSDDGAEGAEAFYTGMASVPVDLTTELTSAFDGVDLGPSGEAIADSFFESFRAQLATIPSRIITAFAPLPGMLASSITNRMIATWVYMTDIMRNRAVAMTANVDMALDHIIFDSAVRTRTAVSNINQALGAIPREITIKLEFEIVPFDNGTPGFTDSGKPPKLQPLRFEEFAEGGTADKGQIFMANENGLEYFSRQTGGKTGIMNNEQMASVIAGAVYKATYDANMASGAGNTHVTAELKTSDRSIAKSADRGKVARGYTLQTKGAT